MTKLNDFRDNPVEISIKNKVLTFEKLSLIKDFIDAYILNVEGMGNYERIVHEFDSNAYVSCFEAALNLEYNTVHTFAKQYFKNYKSEKGVDK